MPVSRAGVPPVQAFLVDIVRLQQGRKEDQSGVGQEAGHLREGLSRIGGMLDDFKADNAVVAVWRPGTILTHKGIISIYMRKPCGAQHRRQDATAASVIENTRRLGL